MTKYKLKIVEGELPYEYLSQIIDIDKMTLPAEYITSMQKLEERCLANKESFVAVILMDTILGYFNFFPISDNTLQQLINGQITNDIFLGAENIEQYSIRKDINIYIITAAVRKEWQNTDVIQLIEESFRKFIRNKMKNGVRIKSLYASVISLDGDKLLRRMGFTPITSNKDLYQITAGEISEL